MDAQLHVAGAPQKPRDHKLFLGHERKGKLSLPVGRYDLKLKKHLKMVCACAWFWGA